MIGKRYFWSVLMATLILVVIIVGAKVIANYQAKLNNDIEAVTFQNSELALGDYLNDHIPAIASDTTDPQSIMPDITGTLKDKLVLGYYTEDFPGDTSSLQAAREYSELLDYVAVFSFYLDEEGNITAMPVLLEDDMPTVALVHNFEGDWFNRDTMEAVLADDTSQKCAADNIVQQALELGFQGIHLDLENFGYDYQAEYVSFVKMLSEQCATQGLSLSIAVPAKTSDTYDQWSGGFDYGALAPLVDFVVLMTYDQHWFGGSPGPIASASWVKDVLDYAVSLVPPEKIMLGIAGYGYDWNVIEVQSNSMVDIESQATKEALEIKWHDEYLVPYLKYYSDGVEHEVWYENDVSLYYKLDLVARYKLKGIAFWRLGFANDAFWQVIARAKS